MDNTNLRKCVLSMIKVRTRFHSSSDSLDQTFSVSVDFVVATDVHQMLAECGNDIQVHCFSFGNLTHTCGPSQDKCKATDKN